MKHAAPLRCLLLPALFASVAQAAALAPADVLGAMHRVADWQLAHLPPAASRHTGDPAAMPRVARVHPTPIDWTFAAYYAGHLALAGVSPRSAEYLAVFARLGREENWRLPFRGTRYNADDHAIGQCYLEYALRTRDPAPVGPVREFFDFLLENPPKNPDSLAFDDYGKSYQVLEKWSWCDALFMAPPTLARLYEYTGDLRYLDYMNNRWWHTAAYLYDRDEHLYHRDSRYFEKREANGQKVFWGRGNGWVLGGLARVLQSMPAAYPDRPRYEQLFRDMCEKFLALQGADGLWRASLLDPDGYPAPETSSTGFAAYAFAWGVNAGLLDRAACWPATLKAWRGLLAHVDAGGKLGSCQPIGADPRKITEDDTDVYGPGAFLLAGAEIYKALLLGQNPHGVLAVQNPTDGHRRWFTVEVPAARLRELTGAADPAGILVFDALTPLLRDTQIKQTGAGPALLFQATIPPNDTRRFILVRKPSGFQGPQSAARTIPISIREAANRGFCDQIAGDGKGGWTDQGPDNDLATMRPGVLEASGVCFEIIDPAQNGGRSALVLGRASRQVASDAGEAAREGADARGGAPEAATVKIAAGENGARPAWRFLYLLHAAANPPKAPGAVLGVLTARYADGSETRRELKNKTDIGDWRDPAAGENLGIAWESENATASIGLYVSRFAIEEKPLASVTFRQAGAAAWMIVALSASTEPVNVGVVAKDFVIEPGPDWAPYAHSLDIEPGGVFDFSSQLDAPAGKHGAIRATPGGHFEFGNRPGARARFWGVNLCFSAQFLDKKDAGLLAEHLARSGYNTVRFHHFDRDLARKGGPSWELDAARLDRLDYLFAALKKRGIYINIDLYASRGFSAEECASWGFAGWAGRSRDLFKAIVPVNAGAFDSWARFAKNLLAHKNPHTGLSWAEDPALIGICPVNENPLFNRIERTPEIFNAYRELFKKAQLPGEPDTRNPAFNQFIHELNRRCDARMAAFLKNELRVRALVTGANYTIAQGLAAVRAEYDYVDCHSYWDHPKFPVKSWTFPIAFGQGSAVKARAKMPNRIMPARVFGRPFVSTEFNFCRPNRHRHEGSVLMPAYASLQDWDALYNFQYAMSDKMAIHGGVENYFAIAADPIGLIGDRVGSLVFQRFDIAPAKNAIVYAVNPEEAFESLGRLFPGEFSPLGLVARIGSLPGRPAEVLAKSAAAPLRSQAIAAAVTGGTKEAPPPRAYLMGDGLAAQLGRDGVIPRDAIDASRTRYASDTGQIELNADTGAVKAVSPRAELFSLAPGAALDGGCVSVAGVTARCAIAVVALPASPREARDTPPLAAARRILVTHLTDALPQGATFAHTDCKLLKTWGKGPHLVRRGAAVLTLRLAAGGWKAWAVDAAGRRMREVPLAPGAGGAFTLEVSTITREGAQLAYELAR